MNARRTLYTAVALGALTVASLPLAAQEASEGPVPTTALITITSKHDEQLDPAQVKLKVNRRDTPITAVTPLVPAHAQVAILIDDGLRSSFGLQLKEMEDFINSLPPGTNVLLGFMENGTVISKGFTKNHEELVQQLRVPMSVRGISASPYFSLETLVKNWPSQEPGPRMVLMLTNGVDPYNGSTSVMNQDSPYVQTAQEAAQRAGVAVYSIYFPNAGMRRGSFSGQSYLQQVAEATGGISFNQGTIPPVSIGPYLNEFRKALLESYTVSFMAVPSGKRGDNLTPIKVTTTQPGVKIISPEAVRPGVSE